MPDLISKYFQSELSPEEDEVLEKLLSTSEEAAGEFAEKAEQAYFELGLPEPTVERSVKRTFRWGGGRFFQVVLVLAGIGVLYWWLHPERVFAPTKGEGSPKELTTPTITLAPVIKDIVPAKLVGPPPNPDFDTYYHNLSVVVNLDKKSRILVRIFGPDGAEVRKLYQGDLKEGEWAFTWNGLLDNGQPAAPGTYRISVEENSGAKSKEVVIRNK